MCSYAVCLLLCLCFSVGAAPADSPASVCLPMNDDAGRGNWIVVTIKLEGGKQLPFIIDTGNPVTLFDDSLKPKLGKSLGTSTIRNFGKSYTTSIYPTPKLFVGNKALKMGDPGICTLDCKRFSSPHGHPVMGILGMDVLVNYCLQLDFQTGTICISDELMTKEKDLGLAFDLVNVGEKMDGCFAIKGNLAGVKDSDSLIDTGFNYDGWLTPKAFEAWTNLAVTPSNGEARSPRGVLAGQIYRDLDLHKIGEEGNGNDQHASINGIGLNVLAQNLVTFDFPRRKMYLKRSSDWRLTKKEDEERTKKSSQSAAVFLGKLNQSNRLPGWIKSDEGGATAAHSERRPLEAITLDSKKAGESNLYHYMLTRPLGGDDDSWKLMKAWKTDQNDQKVEEYSIP